LLTHRHQYPTIPTLGDRNRSSSFDIEDAGDLDFKSDTSDLEGNSAENLFSDFRKPSIQFSDPGSISVTPGEGTYIVANSRPAKGRKNTSHSSEGFNDIPHGTASLLGSSATPKRFFSIKSVATKISCTLLRGSTSGTSQLAAGVEHHFLRRDSQDRVYPRKMGGSSCLPILTPRLRRRLDRSGARSPWVDRRSSQFKSRVGLLREISESVEPTLAWDVENLG
jgi:hypothetical protein